MSEGKMSDGITRLLVKDRELLNPDQSELVRWLDVHGFHGWGNHGFYSGVDWIYINLQSKIYAPGMPGVGITSVFGDHAISRQDFYTIYEIFDKYKGIPFLKIEKPKDEATEADGGKRSIYRRR